MIAFMILVYFQLPNFLGVDSELATAWTVVLRCFQAAPVCV